MLAQRWTARNAAGKLPAPLGPRAWSQSSPTRERSPGIFGAGTLSPSGSTERVGRTAVQTAAQGSFCSFIFILDLP